MIVSRKDYYKILGVHKDADQAAIKRAYRRLALKHHPDVHTAQHGPARFLEIQEAYTVLSDPERRRRYDGTRQGRARPPGEALARAKAARPTSAPSRQLFRINIEGLGLNILGLNIGASLETGRGGRAAPRARRPARGSGQAGSRRPRDRR
jgi:DnaJ-class molecular chaperone